MSDIEKLPQNEPLKAIPIVSEYTEAKEDNKGLIQLMMVPPPGKGLKGFVERKLKLVKPVRVNLDERGTFFWKLIDGKRTLENIRKKLKKNYNLKKDESTEAVIEFVKMLMVRNLIMLKLPQYTAEG